MKKILFFLFCMSLLCYSKIQAQQIIATRIDSNANKRAQSVYLELLGNGSDYSLNYDVRFHNRPDGLGARAGLSYFLNESDNYFSAPVVLNYLAGKRGKYFETGVGLTFYSGNIRPQFYSDPKFGYEESDYDILNGKDYTQVFGTLIFGYRSQPAAEGFMFRAGLSPIIAKRLFIPWWPYASFGYKF